MHSKKLLKYVLSFGILNASTSIYAAPIFNPPVGTSYATSQDVIYTSPVSGNQDNLKINNSLPNQVYNVTIQNGGNMINTAGLSRDIINMGPSFELPNDVFVVVQNGGAMTQNSISKQIIDDDASLCAGTLRLTVEAGGTTFGTFKGSFYRTASEIINNGNMSGFNYTTLTKVNNTGTMEGFIVTRNNAIVTNSGTMSDGINLGFDSEINNDGSGVINGDIQGNSNTSLNIGKNVTNAFVTNGNIDEITNITVFNNSSLTVSDNNTVSEFLSIGGAGSLAINPGGTVKVKYENALAITGAIVNSGNLVVNDLFDATLSSSFTNPNGTIDVNGDGSIIGNISATGASFLNIGTDNSCNFTTQGSISEFSTININTGSSFTSHHPIDGVDALFSTAAGATTSLNAPFDAVGNIKNNGMMTIANTFDSSDIENNSGATLDVVTNGVVSSFISNMSGAILNVKGGVISDIESAGTINIYNRLDSTGGIYNIGFLNMYDSINVSNSYLYNVDSGVMDIHGNHTVDAILFTSFATQNYTITNKTTFDSITASCPIDISDGTVNILSSYVGPGGTAFTWNILTGTSIATNGGTTITIPASSTLGDWSYQILGGNILQVSYLRSGGGSSFTPAPGVPTEIANVLLDMSNGTTNSGQDALLNAVNSATTQDQYNYILENLQPNTTTNSVTMNMQNIGFNKIETRIGGSRSKSVMAKRNSRKQQKKNKKSAKSGIASGDLHNNAAMWLSGFGSISKQRSDGENQGYRAKILGGMLGFDFKSKNDDIYGVALGISNANVYALVNTTNTTRVLGYNLIFYGSNNLPKSFFAEWIVSGVVNKNYGVRVFGINGTDLSTAASYRGALGGARVNLGKDINLNSVMQVSPVVMGQYVLVHQPSYDESDSVAALHVSTKDNQSIATLGAGLRLGLFNNDRWLYGARELSAMVTYDVLSPGQTTTANFIVGSNAFDMTSSPARLAIKLGADCGFTIFEKLNLQLSYNYEIRSGYYDNFGEIKLRYLF